METCFKTLKKKWNTANARSKGRYFGVVIDDPSDPMMRLADDVLLIAQSKSDICKMIANLREESNKYGLKLHMGKTKILTNVSCHQKDVLVGDDTIQIITDGAERYQGKTLSLWNYHTIEHTNRLAAGWAVFTKNKHVLCSGSFSIQQ